VPSHLLRADAQARADLGMAQTFACEQHDLKLPSGQSLAADDDRAWRRE
jgi:hypothetical protein